MNLLSFYNVRLPSAEMQSTASQDNAFHHPICEVSVRLLNDRSAWVLTKYVPVAVGADGNCMFRSVSKFLYGSSRSPTSSVFVRGVK